LSLRQERWEVVPARRGGCETGWLAFFVKRQKNEAAKVVEFGCVSLRIEKVFQFSIVVGFSCEATGASWKIQLFKPAALRSCKVFENLYSYF